MAAGAWVFFAGARTDLLDGTFDLDTQAFKMALMASTAVVAASNTDFASVSGDEVTDASTGYTAGGATITLALTGSEQVKVDISTDPSWTATTDGITARYAILYHASTNDETMCYCPLQSDSSDVVVTTGNTLTVAAHANGVFTLS